MNNDDGMAKRRARLQALRGRYEQPSHSPNRAASIAPATLMADPAALAQEGRRGQGGRGARRGQTGPGQRGERPGGGLLQRFAQFLAETPPGDTLIPGASISEQRLQQAMRLLEQRARNAQGGANERIQRLLKFLKQDIPGEPMAGGVNLWRLQQILERVGRLSEADQISPTVASSAPPAGVNRERMVAAGRQEIPPLPEPVRDEELEEAGEIATLEADLQRLQAVAQDLQARLEQARQRAKPPSNARPLPNSAPPVGRPPEANAPPQSSGDDWFMEFLE